MIQKTITFKDYKGVERTEDHFFHLNKAELAKMELSTKGGFIDMTQRLIAAQDMPALYKVVEDFVIASYGVISPDGREFMKSPEITRSFVQTEAFAEMFVELISDPTGKKMADFVNGIIPEGAANQQTPVASTNV